MHFARGNVGGDGDDTLAAECHDSGCRAVVAAPDGEVRRAEVEGVLNEVEVVARLLDTGNVRMLGKRLIGLRRAADACAGGNVVGDDRDMYRSGDCAVVGKQTLRRGLVVVGGDDQQTATPRRSAARAFSRAT